MTAIAERLDVVTADRRLLDHPFYKAWAAGELSTEDLSFYSTQYWRQVESFPRYLEDVQKRLPEGAARAIVASNLADERDQDHAGLWRNFASAVGAADLDGAEPEPETTACVNTFADGAAARSLPYALGMLYAYESQTPQVADTKVKGLREHYGIDGDGVTYFELHGKLDVEHAAELGTALEEVVETDDDRIQAAAGARAGAAAIYTLLDGVARVRGIC
ncbi:MAG TPA: iron-containing redox enzyme family protein [Actinomycetota bacterium]|nr:iron-containing redox enzyme family protein [Actinomycetota bacterium]